MYHQAKFKLEKRLFNCYHLTSKIKINQMPPAIMRDYFFAVKTYWDFYGGF